MSDRVEIGPHDFEMDLQRQVALIVTPVTARHHGKIVSDFDARKIDSDFLSGKIVSYFLVAMPLTRDGSGNKLYVRRA
jgi:hypothetical protein